MVGGGRGGIEGWSSAGSLWCGNRTQETDAYTRGEGTIRVLFLVRSGGTRGRETQITWIGPCFSLKRPPKKEEAEEECFQDRPIGDPLKAQEGSASFLLWFSVGRSIGSSGSRVEDGDADTAMEIVAELAAALFVFW